MCKRLLKSHTMYVCVFVFIEFYKHALVF